MYILILEENTLRPIVLTDKKEIWQSYNILGKF